MVPVAEVREALRRLHETATLLENAKFLLSRDEPYLQALNDVAAQLEVLVTVGSGFPAAWTRPARAAACLSAWLGEDSAARRLADGLAVCEVVPPADPAGEGPSAQQVRRLLRQAAIGWGQKGDR